MRKFSRLLDELWRGRRAGAPDELAEELVQSAEAAVEAIRPFVIRHGVEDLPAREQAAFGKVDQEWEQCAEEPPVELLEAMLRTDRALALGRRSGAWAKRRTNDPRHHVGSHQLTNDLEAILKHKSDDADHAHAIAHARVAKRLLKSNGAHAKIASSVRSVQRIVAAGEKVLVFCDHHATATELAAALARSLRWEPAADGAAPAIWHEAWARVFADVHGSEELGAQARARFDRFVDWLCSPGVRAQVYSWMNGREHAEAARLARTLESTRARRLRQCETIAKHARDLYLQLIDEESTSTRSILSNAHSRGLPGFRLARVAAVCDAGDQDGHHPNVFFPKEPDATLAVFNSPFGPDVLVATDRLSEGIDLHLFCRHLIHHELDPSPVRTVQRNGRIRRVNSWAARSKQPIRIAYPALRGTRDEKLVEIMRYRLLQFDLLLGGVRVEVKPEDESAAPSTTLEILAHARSRLEHLRLSL